MMLARVCRAGASPALASFLKSPVPKPLIPRIQSSRLFVSGRSPHTRRYRYRTFNFTENAMGSSGNAAISLGKGAVAGGAIIGLGALCYYGLGISQTSGAIDRAGIWPKYVKDRIKTTYMYFGATVAATAASAAACVRCAPIVRMTMSSPLLVSVSTFIGFVGTLWGLRSIPYKEGFGPKQAAWLAFTGISGLFVAPLLLLSGPLLFRAAWYTTGIVGGLSAVAVCAPDEKFLMMGGPLAIGMGVVIASSIGSLFLPPTTAVGSSLYAISVYGGLIVFSMFLMYSTQMMIKEAERYPEYGLYTRQYDPINNAINIYINTLNIFMSVIQMLNGSKKK